MAAAVSSPSIMDLKVQATYPIRLGASITKPESATRYASIRYNYRPALPSNADVKATIEEQQDEHRLVIDAEDGEYEYNGQYERQESSFVLVLRGEGKEREMTLERVDGSHGFNLVKTPHEDDAAKLERKHAHLHSGESDEDDLFGEADEDMPPDDANPFDYRHFLTADSNKTETTQPAHNPSRSTISTPLVQHAAASTPVGRSVKAAAKKAPAAKRKSAAADKLNSKRVKAGQEPAPAPAEPAKAKAKPVAPKIRVDRKASIRTTSFEDSGELILENETPVTERPPKNAMAMALQGQLGAGPISLRSAASSPGVASPMPNKEEEVQEYEFEFGNSSSPEPEDPVDQPSQDDGGEADLDGEDDDADVDDLELPSPATKHRPSVSAAIVGGGEEDEDDMEKQLELAMAAEDNESEESEEE